MPGVARAKRLITIMPFDAAHIRHSLRGWAWLGTSHLVWKSGKWANFWPFVEVKIGFLGLALQQ